MRKMSIWLDLAVVALSLVNMGVACMHHETRAIMGWLVSSLGWALALKNALDYNDIYDEFMSHLKRLVDRGGSQ